MKLRLTLNLIVVLCVLLACVLCFTSSYAWYSTAPGTDQTIEVTADGVIYINFAMSVDVLGEDDDERIMKPAVALPFAIANGAPIDVLKTYEETKSTATPSYVKTAATYGDYLGEFGFSQEETKESYLSFDLSMFLDYNDPGTQLGRAEFVIDEIAFHYVNEEGVDVDCLTHDSSCFVSDDNTHGRLYVKGAQRIFFSVKMHIAQVDELMDSRLGQTSSVYCGIAIAVVEP